MQARHDNGMGRLAIIGKHLRDGAAPVVDLVYPPRCPACGDAIGEHGGLCQECWSGLAIPGDPSCSLCQRPFGEGASEQERICAPCLGKKPIHDGIAAGTLYTDVSRKLVLGFKHGRKIGLAPLLARLIAARVPPGPVGRLIVPVPLHRWRLWTRGFNQAALLGRELERAGRGRLVVDALERTRATPSLGGMGAKARAKVLGGAIKVRATMVAQLEGRDILLVDDVLTSGATSEACVRALKRAGAKSVVICCFSRVLDEALASAKQQKLSQ